jgi:hypothetical protein
MGDPMPQEQQPNLAWIEQFLPINPVNIYDYFFGDGSIHVRDNEADDESTKKS